MMKLIHNYFVMEYFKAFTTLALLFMSTAASSQNSYQENMEKKINSKTIVFIHGLFMNDLSWSEWKTFFEREGYTCYTPANPKHKGQPAELRANPPLGLEDVQFKDWITNLESLIDNLPERPILIGHSFGGLTAQKLAESGRAEAAILISSVPPKGINTLKPSFIKANNKVLSPFKRNSIFNPEEKNYKEWFHFAIANTLTKDQSDAFFEQFAVPESRQTPRAALKKIAKVDTRKPHVPLLFIGGLEDVIVPNVLIRKTIKKYTDKNSIIDSKFFEGKDHFICGAPGWEQIADYCLDWVSQ